MEPEWWQTFFDLEYGRCQLECTAPSQLESIAATAKGLAQLLAASPGQLLFDQCCGMGRMSLALGRQGFRTVGVDWSEAYVAAARRRAAAEQLPCRFERGDAFEFVAPEPCDAGFNWFTSFGYSEDDDRSRRMLERMHESLRPGGRFLLEILSAPRVLATFRPRFFQRSPNPEQGGLLILEEAEIDFRCGVVRSIWTFIREDGARDERRVVTRLFMPHELVRLCESAGFAVIDLLGGVDGTPFNRESPRLLLLAERR